METTYDIVRRYLETRNSLAALVKMPYRENEDFARAIRHATKFLLDDKEAAEAALDNESPEYPSRIEFGLLCELASPHVKLAADSLDYSVEPLLDRIYEMLASGSFAQLYEDDSGWEELSGPAPIRTYARQTCEAINLYNIRMVKNTREQSNCP